VARVQLGLGGRRGLIGRSRCPTRRCTGRSPRASARNTKAHGGPGRRCIIDVAVQGFAGERQNVGQAGPHLGAVGVLAAKAIVSRLQLCRRPSAISAVCCGGWIDSAPRAAGIDRRNCREGATTPPHRLRWGRPRAGRKQPGLESHDRLFGGRSLGRVSEETRWPARQSRTWATIKAPRRTRLAPRR
jgi:hypothetical protein